MNVQEFKPAEQKLCVFALNSRLQKRYLKELNCLERVHSAVCEAVSSAYPSFVVLPADEMHIWMAYNRHSHYTMHRDDIEKNYALTVVVHLSLGTSSLYVHGAEEKAIFERPGIAYAIPSKFYHRSAEAQGRTLKAAFFFLPRDQADIQMKEEPPPNSQEEPSEIPPTPPGLQATPPEPQE